MPSITAGSLGHQTAARGSTPANPAGRTTLMRAVCGAVLCFFTLTGMATTLGVVALTWSGILTW
jgi:hypothetical protein